MAVALNKDSKIVIVGAGVFGLSAALHLIQRGYTNIHIFDRQPFDKNSYDETQGAHGASSDANKILRASYGGKKLYQSLAFKAVSIWDEWNRQLAATPKDQLPQSLDPDVPLWHNCGYARLKGVCGLDKSEIDTQANFPSEIKHTQYRVSDRQRRIDAAKTGIPQTKLDPFGRLPRGLPTDGILDMTAGFVLASRACVWALHLAQKSNCVTCHFGLEHSLLNLLKTGNRVTGIVTNSLRHSADYVLIACGGWTPFLVPETQTLLETTAGSVVNIQLPQNRPDLWAKYSPENFPVWHWNLGTYVPGSGGIGGLYGFPRTPEGIVKIGFRGVKWTPGGKEQIPQPQAHIDQVPKEAMSVIRTFVEENLTDLLDLDLMNARLCWYTDSFNNDWLIDHVPGWEGLVVASGGSGHGFKFLPVLGEHIVDVMERKKTAYRRLFQWRDTQDEPKLAWPTLDKEELVGNKEWRSGVSGKSRL